MFQIKIVPREILHKKGFSICPTKVETKGAGGCNVTHFFTVHLHKPFSGKCRIFNMLRPYRLQLTERMQITPKHVPLHLTLNPPPPQYQQLYFITSQNFHRYQYWVGCKFGTREEMGRWNFIICNMGIVLKVFKVVELDSNVSFAGKRKWWPSRKGGAQKWEWQKGQ